MTNGEKIEYAKTSYSFNFRGENETECHRILILLQYWITFKKTPENKGKNTRKTNSKRRNLKIFSPPYEIIQRIERKMKVVHQKDDKNMAIILR